MNHLEQKQVVAYLRCSTEEQARSGLGIEAQRATIEQNAPLKGWTDIDWVVDDGYTGSNVDRPGLTHALLSLRTGTADTLVVSKLDRLSRSLRDFAEMMIVAKAEGWNLVALDLGIDLSTPSGQLIGNVMASFAEFERRLISQRTTDALRALAAQGVVLGRPRVVSPAVAEMVGRWRAAGCSWQACAQALNDAGVPTAHGGRQWYASTVRKVWQSHERRQAVA